MRSTITDLAEKIERKIENTESRCKNEARKLVDFKLKSVSGRSAKGSAAGRSGSRATLSRAGPSEPLAREGTTSNNSLLPAKSKEGLFSDRVKPPAAAIAEQEQEESKLASLNITVTGVEESPVQSRNVEIRASQET